MPLNQKTDEDKMIKKLEEHRDTIKMVVEIGKLNGIQVKPTINNNSNGDFIYPKDKEEELLKALDKYIGKYKHKNGDKDEK